MFPPGLRRVSMVALEQATEPLPAHDGSISARSLGWFHRPTVVQSLVRPFQIMVLDVLLNYVSNVSFPEEDHTV